MHLERPPLGVGGVRQRLVGGVRGFVERVVLVVGPDAGHLARAHEAGHVVDVPVRLLGVYAVLDPDHLVDAQVLAQVVLDLLLRELGVAPLGQEAHLRGHHGAFAVHVDGAALQHERVRAVAVHAGEVGHLQAHERVLVPREVQAVHQPAPCVEVPVHRAHVAVVVHHERGAAVADPRVVAGHLHDQDVLLARQHVVRGGVVLGVHAHDDRLEPGDAARHVGVRLLCGLRAVAPVVGTMRPQHPDALLRLKLAGHAVAVLLRGRFVLVNCIHKYVLSGLVVILSERSVFVGSRLAPAAAAPAIAARDPSTARLRRSAQDDTGRFTPDRAARGR